MSKPTDTQIEIAERLQLKLLEEFESRIDDGCATSTDLATLARLLQQNGWSINPADIPQDLRSMLTRDVDPDKDLEDRQIKAMP